MGFNMQYKLNSLTHANNLTDYTKSDLTFYLGNIDIKQNQDKILIGKLAEMITKSIAKKCLILKNNKL